MVLRNVFLKILNIIDPSFQANFKSNFAEMINRHAASGGALSSGRHGRQVEATRSDAARMASPKSLAGVQVEHAVLLSTNHSLASSEAIWFLVCGIFQDEKLSSHILNQIKNQLTGAQTLEEIENLIDKCLAANFDQNESILSECREKFFNHKNEKRENERAYLVEDKPRPTAVFWPNPVDQNNLRSIYDELPYVTQEKIINPATAVGSAGSCFASEIAIALQKESFNYVVTEPNIGVDGSYRFMSPSERPVSCAAWGTIFNTPSFRQLAEKAFDERILPKILWHTRVNGVNKYYDPFRENIEFESPEAFEENYDKHKAAAREAFLKLDVFVVTLGLNEVWYFKADGSAFSRSPWRIAPSLVERRILTVEENVADLQRMLDILRVHNKNIKLIVTLSPIGLHATFRADAQHVITANSHSKAVLRVAAEEFVRRNTGVYYFPSYEMVNFCTKDPYLPDQRNVRPETVQNVMRLFKEIYVS